MEQGTRKVQQGTGMPKWSPILPCSPQERLLHLFVFSFQERSLLAQPSQLLRFRRLLINPGTIVKISMVVIAVATEVGYIITIATAIIIIISTAIAIIIIIITTAIATIIIITTTIRLERK